MAVQDATPRDRDGLCEECSIHSRVRTICLPAEGEPGGLLVISDAPGEQEDRHARPLVGQTGQYVRSQIARFWTGPVVYDYAVKCAPGATKLGSGHVAACRPYLSAVWRDAAPQRIICLGTTATEAVLGKSFPPLSVRRGYAYVGDVPVYILAPPGQGLRNRFVRTWFEEDLEWAIKGPLPTKPPLDGKVYLVESEADAQQAVAELRAGVDALDYNSIIVDTETFGAHHDADLEIVTVGLSPAGSDFAFIWEHEWLKKQEVLAPLLDFLVDKSIPFAAQNAKFDACQIESFFRARMEFEADTQLMRRILQADALNKLEVMQVLVGMAGGKDEAGHWVAEGSKVLAKAIKNDLDVIEFGGIAPAKVEMALDRIREGHSTKRYAYAYIPPDIRARYCALDCISTGLLRQKFAVEMAQEPGFGLFWNSVGRELLYGITRMEYNGIKTSRAAVRALQTHLEERIDALKVTLSGYGSFNPNSTIDVAKILFDDLKLPVKSATKRGKRQVNKEVLKSLDHPLCDAIMEYRRWTKFQSNYANGMDTQIRDDGRIHPQIRIDGTETGRPSCTEPNLMNIPRPTTPEGKMCRDIFVAGEGYVLLEADYSQIELRVAAMLSGDPVMIQTFKTGLDFHLATAKMIAPILSINADEVNKEHWLRDAAKTINFAILYGTPPVATAATLKINRGKAQALHDAIFGKFNVLKRWIDAQLAYGRRHGFVRTWWNGQDALKRPLFMVADANEEARSTAEKSCWNTPIQGTAATFTNASIPAIQRWIDKTCADSRLVLTVYDSILQEVRADYVDIVAANTRRIMEQWPSGDVPIIADLKVGTAWGSLSKYVPKNAAI